MISGATLNTEAVYTIYLEYDCNSLPVLFFSLNLFFKKCVAWKSYHSLSKVGSIVTLTGCGRSDSCSHRTKLSHISHYA